MTTLLNGLLGGLLVGLVAGAVARIVDSDAAATAIPPNRSAGAAAATSHRKALAASVLYGGLAGGSLLALELFALGVLAVPPALGEALGLAVAWSALLVALWAVGSRVGLSVPLDPSRRALIVYHLVYGIGFGVWIRVTWLT